MPQKIYLQDLPKSFFKSPSDQAAFDPSSFIETSTPIDQCKLKINPLPGGSAKYKFSISLGKQMHSFRCSLSLANTVIELGDNLSGSLRVSCWHGSSLKIGDQTSISQMRVVLDRNCSCSIGSDCLISDGVLLQIGDQHAIFDVTTKGVINKAWSRLSIGDHVWLGRDSTTIASSDLFFFAILSMVEKLSTHHVSHIESS